MAIRLPAASWIAASLALLAMTDCFSVSAGFEYWSCQYEDYSAMIKWAKSLKLAALLCGISDQAFAKDAAPSVEARAKPMGYLPLALPLTAQAVSSNILFLPVMAKQGTAHCSASAKTFLGHEKFSRFFQFSLDSNFAEA